MLSVAGAAVGTLAAMVSAAADRQPDAGEYSTARGRRASMAAPSRSASAVIVGTTIVLRARAGAACCCAARSSTTCAPANAAARGARARSTPCWSPAKWRSRAPCSSARRCSCGPSAGMMDTPTGIDAGDVVISSVQLSGRDYADWRKTGRVHGAHHRQHSPPARRHRGGRQQLPAVRGRLARRLRHRGRAAHRRGRRMRRKCSISASATATSRRWARRWRDGRAFTTADEMDSAGRRDRQRNLRAAILLRWPRRSAG